jgi:hypothetical protein
MKTRGIIGRTIVAIEQERMNSTGRCDAPHVTKIVLDNGWWLEPVTVEHYEGAFYGTDFFVHKPKAKPNG